MELEYVSFDFETANDSRTSACALGAVKIKDGKEVDSFYTLINPEEDFGGIQTTIHGITKKDVAESPKFVEVYNKFDEFVGDLPVVSHTPFDRSVIIAANNKYNNRFKNLEYFDSYFLSSSIWKGKYFKFGLEPLSERVGFEFEHHNALEDARACAFIIQKLIMDTQVNTILELQQKAGCSGLAHISYEANIRPNRVGRGKCKASELKASEIKELMSTIDQSTLDKNHPFFNKKICITGKVSNGINRSDCQKAIIEVGGEPQVSVLKTTDILVQGKQTSNKLKNDMSSKYKKAKELFDSGSKITFLSCDEFLEIINS